MFVLATPGWLFCFTLLALCLAFSACETSAREQRLIKKGNEMVVEIERYRTQKGQLPNSLTEIGERESEEGPIYYEKQTETRYRLWFGTTLGESVTYDSDQKKWE